MVFYSDVLKRDSQLSRSVWCSWSVLGSSQSQSEVLHRVGHKRYKDSSYHTCHGSWISMGLRHVTEGERKGRGSVLRRGREGEMC